MTGEAVFPGSQFKDVLQKNKLCAINFDKNIYDPLSKQAKDLLMRMLDKNPETRITTSEALKHPFFTLKDKLAKMPSFEEVPDVFDEEQMNTREKGTSLFAKPQRIPYLRAQENLNSKN